MVAEQGRKLKVIWVDVVAPNYICKLLVHSVAKNMRF